MALNVNVFRSLFNIDLAAFRSLPQNRQQTTTNAGCFDGVHAKSLQEPTMNKRIV